MKVAEKSWLGPVRRAANKAGTLLGDPKLWEEPRKTSLCECTYGEGVVRQAEEEWNYAR